MYTRAAILTAAVSNSMMEYGSEGDGERRRRAALLHTATGGLP